MRKESGFKEAMTSILSVMQFLCRMWWARFRPDVGPQIHEQQKTEGGWNYDCG